MERREVKILRGELPEWVMSANSSDGYGDGSGDGYGSGYGDGSGSGYWPLIAEAQIQTWPTSQQSRFKEAYATATALAFWKSGVDGMPLNGGTSKDAARPGLVQKISGPLEICSRALHATMHPDKWKGERLWVVALWGEVVWQEDKCAGLKREIIGEISDLDRTRREPRCPR